MALIGYHASHEQFPPSELTRCVKLAEAAGFQGIMSSDHFAPWGKNQGESGFAWSWLGAAMAVTALPFGVVTSPIGLRYHPALIAQAGATLAEMFPGRFWMAVGSGEALNERVVGGGWPVKDERNRRLAEAVEIIRRLWADEEVTRTGMITTEGARIYTRAADPPSLIAAALTPETARWAGAWADGLVTINQPRPALARIVEAFREGGGAGKPLYLQVHLSYAPTEALARQNAHEQWRTNALPSSVAAELRSPAMFDQATSFVRAEDLKDSVRMSSDCSQHAAWLAEDIEQGFDHIFLHNVGRNQKEFIEAFGTEVLPGLSR